LTYFGARADFRIKTAKICADKNRDDLDQAFHRAFRGPVGRRPQMPKVGETNLKARTTNMRTYQFNATSETSKDQRRSDTRTRQTRY
jgi:hypothetical protein